VLLIPGESSRAESTVMTSDPYCPLGTIGTVPRAYDILWPTKEWKGDK
jgi:hypothetical protein